MVVAGGYDERVRENKSNLMELERLVGEYTCGKITVCKAVPELDGEITLKILVGLPL